jgi:hypothetical protein
MRALDGSDVDISNISLEVPPAAGEEIQEMEELRSTNEEEVLFER